MPVADCPLRADASMRILEAGDDLELAAATCAALDFDAEYALQLELLALARCDAHAGVQAEQLLPGPWAHRNAVRPLALRAGDAHGTAP